MEEAGAEEEDVEEGGVESESPNHAQVFRQIGIPANSRPRKSKQS